MAESTNSKNPVIGSVDTSDLRIGSLNPCSSCNKALLVWKLIVDEELNVLAHTETFKLASSPILWLLNYYYPDMALFITEEMMADVAEE